MFEGGGAEALDAAEFFEEGGFAAFADAGEFVEDALGNFFEAEFGVVGVGEAMGFVADALEEFEGAGVVIEAEGIDFAGAEDFFVFLGEADDGDVGEAEFGEFRAGGVELAFAAIDEDEVGDVGPFVGSNGIAGN